DAQLPKILQPIRAHLDDIVSPFQQAESIHTDLLELMPEQVVDALVLAWHHEHLAYQSSGKHKHYHQYLRCGKVILAFGPCEDVRQANGATALAPQPVAAR